MIAQREKEIRFVFVASLILKGLFAFAETISGIGAYGISFAGNVITGFLPQEFLLNFVQGITQEELLENPGDIVANYLLQAAQALSVNTLHFAALYLLVHGVVKLWLVIGLLRKRLWYYPTALVVFCMFIVYQAYRYTFTHSLALVFITIIDLVVVGLTWHEYQYLKRVK